jgi:hypothetical protein
MPRDVAHAWKNAATAAGRVLFLYTPAAAGGYIEAMADHPGGAMTEAERDELYARYRWEIVGPNPL